MPYKKIVVGIDGSDTSLAALEYAARLAAVEGAEIVGVYAHGISDEAAVAQAASEVITRAEEAVTGLDVSFTAKSSPGDPAEVLIDSIEDPATELLVVGNKGMTGVSRFLLGSVPNKVSHHSPCDLLIVRTT
ncbi:MAG TPA: universal stress protein [Actinomycetota bacterium]|nr:universal stress protein [Actinomycetota bacterium]